MKFPLKEPPIQSQTHFVSQNRAGLWVWLRIWIRVRIFPRRNFPIRFLRQRRRFLRGFTARVNLCRRIRLYRILIWWRSATLLSERHARIFLGGCSHRAILAKHVASFAWKRTSLWILSWEQIFLGSITGSSPVWKILTCLFSISYVIVKSVLSAFEDRHHFTKIGENRSHCLVTNELRKKDGDKGKSLAICERTNSFAEIKAYFRIIKTALDPCTWEFLLCGFWSKDQKQLWRRHFVQSTNFCHSLRL